MILIIISFFDFYKKICYYIYIIKKKVSDTMYEIIGYMFDPQGNPIKLKNIPTNSYQEVHETFEALGIKNYIFMLKEVK